MTHEQKKYHVLLTEAHDTYEKALRAHAYYKVHDQNISQDLVQNTFMKTWLYLVKGGKIETMKAFLYHVLNHLIIDEYRKRKTASLDALLEKGFEPSIDDEGRLSNVFDGKKAIILISRLPEKYRAVIQMRFIRDLSLGEISNITNQPRNTIAVQIHRGLFKLKLLCDCPQSQLS